MAVLRNTVIGGLRRTGVPNIAAANRYHGRDSARPLYYFAGAWGCETSLTAPPVHPTG